MNKNELLTSRAATSDDLAFIFSTWLKGYQGGLKWFRKTPRNIFSSQYSPIIQAILNQSKTKIICLLSEPTVIIGYCVYQDSKVHWLYVKENWRKIGIAKDLLPANFDTVSHLTQLGFEILKKYPKIIYNPFL